MKRADRYGDYIFFRERLVIEKQKLLKEIKDIDKCLEEIEGKINESIRSTKKTA